MSDLETAQPCFVCGGTGQKAYTVTTVSADGTVTREVKTRRCGWCWGTGREIATEEWGRLRGQEEGNDAGE